MIFHWGDKSTRNRVLLSVKMQQIVDRALNYGIMDFMIDCSFRNETEQGRLFKIGKSKVGWPDSKHNKVPAKAADCVPVINGKPSWKYVHCCVLAGLILAAGVEEGVALRWGGNWDMDGEPITDQDFQDLVHFEEVRV